jgi:hypothetical protein
VISGAHAVARRASRVLLMSTDAAIGLSTRSARYFPSVWFGVAALVFFVVVFRVFGISKDWLNYDDIFDVLRVSGLGDGDEDYERIEIGFKLVALGFIGLSLSNTATYALIASIAVLVKCVAMNVLSRSGAAYFFAICFYLFAFAPLHELTQLRAALAIAFLFVSYALLIRGRYPLALGVAVAAIAFHISSVIMLPLFILIFLFQQKVFVLTRARAISFGLGVFVIVATVIAVLISYFEEELPIIAAYQELGFGDAPTNPLAPHILLNLAMVLTGLVLWRDLSRSMRYVLFFQLAGLGVFYAALDFQVVSSRVYDLTQTFWVFFIAEGADSENPPVRFATQVFVLAAVAAFAYIYFFSGSFFQ